MSKQTIWLMDSDFCDNCDELLDPGDGDGLCYICSELYLMQEDEEDWYVDDEELEVSHV